MALGGRWWHSRVTVDRSCPAAMGREKQRWAELRLSQMLVERLSERREGGMDGLMDGEEMDSSSYVAPSSIPPSSSSAPWVCLIAHPLITS